MRETNSIGAISKEDKKGVTPNKGNEDSKDNANVSTDISPDKPTPTAPNTNTDDISPEGLLEVISQEWKNEMERIKALGLNGYKRRKESRNECLV
jgi:hypothetical protein